MLAFLNIWHWHLLSWIYDTDICCPDTESSGPECLTWTHAVLNDTTLAMSDTDTLYSECLTLLLLSWMFESTALAVLNMSWTHAVVNVWHWLLLCWMFDTVFAVLNIWHCSCCYECLTPLLLSRIFDTASCSYIKSAMVTNKNTLNSLSPSDSEQIHELFHCKFSVFRVCVVVFCQKRFFRLSFKIRSNSLRYPLFAHCKTKTTTHGQGSSFLWHPSVCVGEPW